MSRRRHFLSYLIVFPKLAAVANNEQTESNEQEEKQQRS